MGSVDLVNCSFYVKKKKRFCKVPPPPGKKFCPHHVYLDPEENVGEKQRIPCPYDPKHYCYLSKLEHHKKKCTARQKEKPLYYKENINAFPPEHDTLKVSIDDVSNDELMETIKKVENIFAECVPPLKKTDVKNAVLEEEMKNSSCISSIKHLTQQSSLLGLLESYKLLSQSSTIIEFGAGRGQLMFWIAKTVPNSEKKTFILVDRETRRYKMDNKLKDDPQLKIERLRIDIQHLNLGEIDSINSNPEKVVGVSKHLCGAATDLALKCLMETITVKNDDAVIKKVPLGLVMSTCCHHRCVWNLYVGKDFILKKGFSEREFKIMCIMSSWATCGLRKRSNAEKNTETVVESQNSGEVNRYVELNLPHAKREEIGRQCKRIIDTGRLNYLQESEMKSELVTYVDSSVSLENVALVGVYKP